MSEQWVVIHSSADVTLAVYGPYTDMLAARRDAGRAGADGAFLVRELRPASAIPGPELR